MPFSTDTLLRNSYVTFWGDIRIGLLLEDVDRMAGAVAYKHVLGRAEDVIQQLADATSAGPNELAHGDVLQSSPKKVTIVTAGVDSIQLFSKISRFDDIKMRGMVVNTGKSSMDVLVEIFAQEGSTKNKVIEANFTMVARDANNKAYPIPQVVATTFEEKEWSLDAQANRDRRKRRAQKSLDIEAPTPDERLIIHKLFTDRKQQNLEGNAQFTSMKSTFHQSVYIMHPQNRNIHNKVFGGYLMRLAMEQAFAAAYLFTGERPVFRAIDEINFLQPVSIGTICTFNSLVVYAHPASDGQDAAVVVEVVTMVVDPATSLEQRTNTFYFTFMCGSSKKQVVPLLYDEAMKYLDGRRRLTEQLDAEGYDRQRLQMPSKL